jgi:hypothetical protein
MHPRPAIDLSNADTIESPIQGASVETPRARGGGRATRRVCAPKDGQGIKRVATQWSRMQSAGAASMRIEDHEKAVGGRSGPWSHSVCLNEVCQIFGARSRWTEPSLQRVL